MPLRFLKLTTVLFFLSSFPIFGLTGNPSCQINGNLKRVHVWYTINNKDNNTSINITKNEREIHSILKIPIVVNLFGKLNKE